MTTSKFLLQENFLQTNKKLYIESKYFVLYDLLLSESIDDELSESVDIYSSFIEEEDCYMIDIDAMFSEAVFYDLYNRFYDSNETYSMYDLSILVLNETVRIYNAMFVHDYSILIRLISNIDSINSSLYEELEYYNNL